MPTETVQQYSYTPAQAEVVRLQDRYRRCLLDQKYYAYRLSLYQGWDTSSNVFAGIAMVLSLVTRPSSNLWLSYICYATGIVAALIFIAKPIFRISDRIERYTLLHYGYADVFNKIEDLVSEIRQSGKMTAEQRLKASEIFDRCATLALREDPTHNHKKLAKFQSDVEVAIPPETLWIPSE